MDLRQKADVWNDIHFALLQLDSAKRLLKRNELGLAEGYYNSALRETVRIVKKIARYI